MSGVRRLSRRRFSTRWAAAIRSFIPLACTVRALRGISTDIPRSARTVHARGMYDRIAAAHRVENRLRLSRRTPLIDYLSASIDIVGPGTQQKDRKRVA